MERDPFEASVRATLSLVYRLIKFSRHRFAKNSPFSFHEGGGGVGGGGGGGGEEGARREGRETRVSAIKAEH